MYNIQQVYKKIGFNGFCFNDWNNITIKESQIIITPYKRITSNGYIVCVAMPNLNIKRVVLWDGKYAFELYSQYIDGVLIIKSHAQSQIEQIILQTEHTEDQLKQHEFICRMYINVPVNKPTKTKKVNRVTEYKPVCGGCEEI